MKSSITVTTETRNGTVKRSKKISRRFKIRGRKNADSALLMSTKALLEELERKPKGKGAMKIRQVLDQRGFNLMAHKAEMARLENERLTAEAAANAEELVDSHPQDIG